MAVKVKNLRLIWVRSWWSSHHFQPRLTIVCPFPCLFLELSGERIVIFLVSFAFHYKTFWLDLGKPSTFVDLLEQIQRRATKMIRRMEHLSYEDRLRAGTVQQWEDKAPLQGDLLAAFQYQNRSCKKVGEELLTRAYSDRTRYKGQKVLHCKRAGLV